MNQWFPDVIFPPLLRLSNFYVILQTGWQGYGPWRRQRIFLLASVSRPALRPSQPPTEWVPRVLPPEVKCGSFYFYHLYLNFDTFSKDLLVTFTGLLCGYFAEDFPPPISNCSVKTIHSPCPTPNPLQHNHVDVWYIVFVLHSDQETWTYT
jgi:hypothetical protein